VFLFRTQNRIPPIFVALLLLLSPLTACSEQHGGRKPTAYQPPAEPTLTVTVRDLSTKDPLAQASVIAQLRYQYNCGLISCDKEVESRAAPSTDNRGRVVIPLLSREIPRPSTLIEVKLFCVKPGYKAGSQTIEYKSQETINCSMVPDKNYQGIGKINVVDKATIQPVLNPQFKFEQSKITIPNGIWEPYEHTTQITVSAYNYHPKTVTVKPNEWPITVKLDQLVYKYELSIKLLDHEGKEINKLPNNAKVSIQFKGTDITPQYSSRFPLTVPTQESKTRSQADQFTIRIHYPPYKEMVVNLDLADSIWESDRYSPGVLKATRYLSLEKTKKGLVVLVNQADAWKGKPYGTWKKSLRKVFNPWWKKQKRFSYFGYGRISAGVYPRLIHQSEPKAPASLIMGETIFDAFVEPHKLADFFLEGNDNAIWPKLSDADEWFFIILLPHNTSYLVHDTVERYESYTGIKGSWQTKLAQLKASLEKYNAHLYIIEDFFKDAECEEPTTEGETPTQGDDDKTCVSQSKERSIIEALSELDRVRYQAIPYETLNDSEAVLTEHKKLIEQQAVTP